MDLLPVSLLALANLIFFVFFSKSASKKILDIISVARQENKDLHRRMCIMEERASRERV